MYYMARFEPDETGLLVTFPDVPEAITGGANRAEARANAAEALELALLTYTKLGRAWPEPAPSPAPADGVFEPVPVSATLQAKSAFVFAFAESGMTQTALARKLGKGETEIRRMLDPYHPTKLASIEAGLSALGKRLVVSVEAA